MLLSQKTLFNIKIALEKFGVNRALIIKYSRKLHISYFRISLKPTSLALMNLMLLAVMFIVSTLIIMMYD